jgi:N-acetylglucosaminyldiphosphoundecaprenol N-acetyl-beta-D-mannosaminyltransferase
MSDVSILGVRLAAQEYDAAISDLLAAVTERRQLRVIFATVHTVVEAGRDAALSNAIATAGKVFADGVPLVWVSWLRGAHGAQRVCGPDVLATLADRGRELNLRHYFLGGEPGVADELRHRLEIRFPGFVGVGSYSPPFRLLTAEENEAIVRKVNAARPDVLWIGLGSPKQEIWAASNEGRLEARLIMPVGAAFNFHSGRVPRAPKWMRQAGLEWLFRLAMEPRRLLGRYVTTNSRFVVMIAREEMRRRSDADAGKTDGNTG